jgi:hypothetical protein
MNFNELAGVNAKLSLAREAYHEAMIVEREAGVLCLGLPPGSTGRKPVQTARERVKQTAEEYEEALEVFSKFTEKRLSAAS